MNIGGNAGDDNRGATCIMTLSDHIPLSVNAQTNLFLFQETPQQLYSDRDVLVSLPLLRKLSVG